MNIAMNHELTGLPDMVTTRSPAGVTSSSVLMWTPAPEIFRISATWDTENNK